MWPPNARLLRLTPAIPLKPFSCGTEDWQLDLNEFFAIDSKPYQEKLLAVTYILEEEAKTIAFFSVANDRISAEDATSPKRFQKDIRKLFPEAKQLRSYPAVKIGRLGVHKDFQRQGIGKDLIDYIKTLFVQSNRTGCRFITVDAYNNPETLKFYTREGFIFLRKDDEDAKTRMMYFDLEPVFRSLSSKEN